MWLLSPLSAALVLSAGATLASPVTTPPTTQGSKHNLYLSTCTRRTGAGVEPCHRRIGCSAADYGQSFDLVAEFSNGDSGSTNYWNNPVQVAIVSDEPLPWEGTQRVANLGRDAFSSVIDVGAASLAKSQIAGSARVANEDFVCFKDGESRFTVNDGERWWGRGRGWNVAICVADYWCASVSV